MNIPAILKSEFYGSEWTLDGDDYEGLTWLSNTKKPSRQELENLSSKVQTSLKSAADAKLAARESALAKLAALGLSADEIASL